VKTCVHGNDVTLPHSCSCEVMRLEVSVDAASFDRLARNLLSTGRPAKALKPSTLPALKADFTCEDVL
jgi:hypothetical protein